MNFVILDNYGRKAPASVGTVYVSVDNWNDYSFVTTFYLTVFDKNKRKKSIKY